MRDINKNKNIIINLFGRSFFEFNQNERIEENEIFKGEITYKETPKPKSNKSNKSKKRIPRKEQSYEAIYSKGYRAGKANAELKGQMK